MDGKDWLRSRQPQPPEKLMARMVSGLGDSYGLSMTEEFLSAGARILEDLTANGGGIDRASAIDLLAADALVTYAVEAAADECDSFDARVDAIMSAVAKVPIN